MFNESLIVIIIINKFTRLLIFVLNILGSFIIIAFDYTEILICLIYLLMKYLII